MPDFGSNVTSSVFSSRSTTITNTGNDPYVNIDWNPVAQGSLTFVANTALFNRVTVDVPTANLPEGGRVYFTSTAQGGGYCPTYFTSDVGIYFLGEERFCPLGARIVYELTKVGNNLYIRGAITQGVASGVARASESLSSVNYGSLTTACLINNGASDPSISGFSGGGYYAEQWLAGGDAAPLRIGKNDGSSWADCTPSNGANSASVTSGLAIPASGSTIYSFPRGANDLYYFTLTGSYGISSGNNWVSTGMPAAPSFYLGHEHYPTQSSPILAGRNLAGNLVFDECGVSSVVTTAHSTIAGAGGGGANSVRVAVNNARTQAVCLRRATTNVYSYDLTLGSGQPWDVINPLAGRTAQDVTYNGQQDVFVVTGTPLATTDQQTSYTAADPNNYNGGDSGPTWQSESRPTGERPPANINLVVPIGPYFLGINNSPGTGFVAGENYCISPTGRSWSTILGPQTTSLPPSGGILVGNGTAILIEGPTAYAVGSVNRTHNPNQRRV